MLGNGQQISFQQEFDKLWDQVDWDQIFEKVLNGQTLPGSTPPIVPGGQAEQVQTVEEIQDTIVSTQPQTQSTNWLPWLGVAGSFLVAKKLFPYALAGTGAYFLLKNRS